MSNFDINVDRRTDGRKIGRLYRTLLQAGAIKIMLFKVNEHTSRFSHHFAKREIAFVTFCLLSCIPIESAFTKGSTL